MNNGVNNNTNTEQTNGIVQQPQQGVVVNGGQVPVAGNVVAPQQNAVVQQPAPQQPVVQQTTVQQPVAPQVTTSTEETTQNPGYNIVPPIEGSVDGTLTSKLRQAEEENKKALEKIKQMEEEKVKAEEEKNKAIEEALSNAPKKRSGGGLILLLFLVCAGLGGYIYYSSKAHESQISNLKYNCTPVLSSKEETKLDVDSTFVKWLYSKVETNIREDIAQPQFNDNMKLYLAYRQVLDSDKYDSNCNLYDNTKMEPLVCDVNGNFVPKAFKKDKLIIAYKQLFGEDAPLELANIQLGKSCVGGYQYIPDRDEYVQGHCTQQNSTFYTVTKKIVEATSSRNRITLKEEVKYGQSEGVVLPEYLKNGYYYYTFRLDLNYNYILVSKTYESKY